MKLRIVANLKKATAEIRYDFIGGPNDGDWIFDVVDSHLEGGYEVPARLHGHPDSWAPAEGENPTVDATLHLWVWPEEKQDVEPDPNRPDYVIEIKDDRIVPDRGKYYPEGVEDFIYETIIPGIIQKGLR